MSKAVIFFAPGLEECEGLLCVDILRRAGVEVTIAAPEEPTLIDINMATAEELTALPGLGPRKAAALVAYREAHGPFATLADAAAVKGISLRMTESWVGLAAANH